MSAKISERAAWRAVLRRDRRCDEAFVYGVRSTRIYCRPSCPARRPERRQVTFFSTADEAESSGYRECRRCRPRSAAGAAIDVCVNAARRYLDQHLDENVTLRTLARHTGFSASHLQRAFKARLGVSPKAYAAARRIERFKHTVRSGSSVTEALYAAGFGSTRGLYERAKRSLGMTPAAYRAGAPGLVIAYGLGRCSLGRVLAAVTEHGLCAVFLGGRTAELERELVREFPKAERVRDQRRIAPTLRRVVAAIDGKPEDTAVTVVLRGTDFEHRVWRELARIPRGETRSYSEIARALGRPAATRAVARACGANRLAVLVPCHRVVRGDGRLAGYRWGLARKRRLLAAERARAPG
jgi:AraC family transcriptional regulator of adaptative response/methylated-DNA-[protein]-cysteine methyltransferase